MEQKLERLPADTDIQKARRKISDQCRLAAEQPGGVYRLNVPTGAGKTLSSLRYALAHAARWNKSRIIFTAPLLTILEQNALYERGHTPKVKPTKACNACSLKGLCLPKILRGGSAHNYVKAGLEEL